MSLKLLCEQLVGISPETKFFLLKFLQCYQWAQPVTFSSKELVRNFGIHDKGIKSALDELCDRKYLVRLRHVTGSRGRPKQAFVTGEALTDLAKNWSATSAPINHELMIERLLDVTPEREKITKLSGIGLLNKVGREKPTTSRLLTNTRKLLLCVLLAKADQFGVIRGLGMTELASLVGLSKEQLRWHLKILKILKNSKYLFDYIPGVVVRGVKGKLKSIFIMQLKWVEGGTSPTQSLFIHDSEALRFFERAVHLVHGLEAVNGQLIDREVSEICKSQFSHWGSIYHFNKIDFEGIIDSAQLLRGIGDDDMANFRRLCTFVCELVAMLVNKYGLIKSLELSGYEVAKMVQEEGKIRKLNMIGTGTRAWMRSLLWFSRLVLKMHDELRELFARSNTKNEALKIRLCLIFPMAHTSNVFINISIEPGQVHEESTSST